MQASRAFPRRTVGVLFTILGAALAGCAENRTTAPSAVPGVVIGATAVSLFVAEHDRVSTEVSITRVGGFAAPVTLSVSGLPAHVTADVAPNPVAGDLASVDIVAGDGVAPGLYHLAVNASATGIEAQTVALDLHVVIPAPVAVAVAYCPDGAPVWVAFEDGDGVWTQAPANVTGSRVTFRHVFVTNRGAIATLTPFLDGALTLLNVLYGAPAELASAGDTNSLDCGNGAAKTLFGNVAGLDPDESALISSGSFLRAPVPAGRTTFKLTGLPSGPQDLLATRTSVVNGTAAVTRLLLRRNIELPDSANLETLDFASPEAFAPVTPTVSVIGLGAEGAINVTRLRTSHSEMVLSFLTNQPTAPMRPYFALPEDRLLPGELQVLHVTTNGPGSVNRDAAVYFRSPADRTVTLGAPLARPLITTLATDPVLRVRAQFAAQSDYDRLTSISFQQDPTTALVAISMTAAYAAINGNGLGLDVPDLSTAAGFDPAWGLRPGAQLLWSATRTGGTLGLGRDAVPSDGTTLRSAFLQDIITAR
jgi:hypothetical protein